MERQRTGGVNSRRHCCTGSRSGYRIPLRLLAGWWITAVFGLAAVLGGAGQAWPAVCAGSLNNSLSPNDPYVVGDTVRITATINNTNLSSFTVTNFVQKLSCQDTTSFSSCTSPDDSVVSYQGNVTTTCPVTWDVDTSVPGVVTFTPHTTLTLAASTSCSLSFDEKIESLSQDTSPYDIQWANQYTGNCPGPLAGSATGSGDFDLVVCSVEVDKQVSCDGGNTFFDVSGVDDTEPPSKTLSDLCIGWNSYQNNGGTVPATDIVVRYKARNTGTIDATCSTSDSCGTDCQEGLTDSNLGILPAGVSVASIPASQTTYTQIDQETAACSGALASNEPDTAALSCQCAAGGRTFLAPISMDSAQFACQTPGLAVTKTCGPVNQSGNAPVTVSYESNGTAALSGCTLTDTVYAGACVNGVPSSNTVVATVTSDQSLTDPTSSPTTVQGLTASGLNTTSCDGPDCCNQATVTCNVTDSPGPETITRSNVADCAITAGDCFTRTPGYWGTHPKAQNILYAIGDVFSCGVDLDTAKASTQGSGTEDICSIGGGKHNPPQSTISNTQRQLERQCAAANMNLAASEFLEVSCEGAYPGINNLIATCCNNADSVCNAGGDTTGCIGALDAFNNFDFTTVAGASSVDATDIVSGPANPTPCRNAKASGFVNSRPRP